MACPTHAMSSHHPVTTLHTRALLFALLQVVPPSARLLGFSYLSAAQHLPPSIAHRLLQSPHPHIRSRVVRHQLIAPHQLDPLLNDPDIQVRASLAASPQLAPHQIAALAHDEAWKVRAELAQRPDLPLNILTDLSKDPHELVRVKAASNPSLPTHLFDALLRDRSAYVSAALAARPDIPPHHVSTLLQHNHPMVRRALAGNAHIAIQMLLPLQHDIPSVLEGLAAHPDLPEPLVRELAKHSSPAVCTAIAKRPSLPFDLVEQIVKHESVIVQVALAQYVPLNHSLQHTLFNYMDDSIHAALAQAPHLSEDLMHNIARSPLVYVRRALAARPYLPLPVAFVLFQNDNDKTMDLEMQVSTALALNPTIPLVFWLKLWHAEIAEPMYPLLALCARPQWQDTIAIPASLTTRRSPVSKLLHVCAAEKLDKDDCLSFVAEVDDASAAMLTAAYIARSKSPWFNYHLYQSALHYKDLGLAFMTDDGDKTITAWI